MSVDSAYSFGMSRQVTTYANRRCARTADARRLTCLTVLSLLPTFAGAADALRTLPRAEECIDVARLNSVSEAERSVLRMEWRAGLARAEESRLLNEMYERIERLQKTTNDIRVLMNAIPSASERAAAINSPSGLGPSAVIPPVVATPPARPPAIPAVAKAPAVEAAAIPSSVAISPQTSVPIAAPPPEPKPVQTQAPVEAPKPPMDLVSAEKAQISINALSPF